MLVGSFSTNHYGIPREDADFVVTLGDRSISTITQALGPAFRLDRQMRFETITGTTRHIVHVPEAAFVVAFFQLSEDPHDQERFRLRRAVRLFDRPAFLPTVEDVIITKLRWSLQGNRPKDRDDIRNVIAVQEAEGASIDWPYIHAWCDRHGTRELLDEIRRSIPPIDIEPIAGHDA
ncbi:MAG: hypothetical protein U0800_15255 [Isosphaeraceae bacterium]